ncbi:MAG: hypothetical protein H7Z10_11805, partial [Gemmatimonadaceae bacterium]|nr:hypothetical protein [Acetobacteraceae bacterium]
MIRPAQLARHVGTLPALALLLAAALPLAGDALRPGLGGFVALVSFACIGAMNATPPNRREAVAALMMAAIPWATCLLTLAAMLAIRLPPDLALAAALIATSPVALGTAARCHQVGLEGRPA